MTFKGVVCFLNDVAFGFLGVFAIFFFLERILLLVCEMLLDDFFEGFLGLWG